MCDKNIFLKKQQPKNRVEDPNNKEFNNTPFHNAQENV